MEVTCEVRHKTPEAFAKCGKTHPLRTMMSVPSVAETVLVSPDFADALDNERAVMANDVTDPEQAEPLVLPGPVPGSFRMFEQRESKHKAGKKPKHGQRDHSKAKKKAAKRAAQNQRPRGKKKGKSWAK